MISHRQSIKRKVDCKRIDFWRQGDRCSPLLVPLDKTGEYEGRGSFVLQGPKTTHPMYQVRTVRENGGTWRYFSLLPVPISKFGSKIEGRWENGLRVDKGVVPIRIRTSERGTGPSTKYFVSCMVVSEHGGGNYSSNRSSLYSRDCFVPGTESCNTKSCHWPMYSGRTSRTSSNLICSLCDYRRDI